MTTKMLLSVMVEEDPHCWFCGVELTKDTATFDHYIQRSNVDFPNRSHSVTGGRVACIDCNSGRGRFGTLLTRNRMRRRYLRDKS